MHRYLHALFICALMVSCNTTNRKDKGSPGTKAAPVRKPSSSYNDTLRIQPNTAVFFSPDSLQLEKIKTVTGSQIFIGSMHEYDYQIINAHSFLRQYWPAVKIIDAKKYRYLLFMSPAVHHLIDLNEKDPCGLFVFDGHQAPLLIDMTNIDTQVPQYFMVKNRPVCPG